MYRDKQSASLLMRMTLLPAALLLLLVSPSLHAEIFNEFLQREYPAFPLETDDEPLSAGEADPDPWENFNRKMYRFNDSLDRALLKPAAETITNIMPEPVNLGVSNFFANLDDVGTSINNLLQGKLIYALSDTGRVLVNTTLGVGGLFDVASRMNLEKHYEDFGQTLGKWGVEPGPYLVLPFLGPASVRDRVGYTVDLVFDLATYYTDDEGVRWVLLGAGILEDRAALLDATDLLDTAALDPYAFQRDAYLQKREYDVMDGELEDDF
jgi:phospholipid-binding lipoprotein MlaA